MKRGRPARTDRFPPRRFLAAGAALLLLAGCAADQPETTPTLQKISFADLPGWEKDDLRAALVAFRAGCRKLTRQPSAGLPPLFREIPDFPGWMQACEAATAFSRGKGNSSARAFFITHFQPWQVTIPGNPGLFTGYYEAEINGALRKTARFRHPIYARPGDLVTVAVNRFDPGLPRKTLIGRVRDGVLFPYPDRAAIETGALPANTRVIAWSDDPVDVFFLHIQGSGRISLPDGDVIRVGYAANNGRPYTAIGRTLIADGEIAKDAVSMQSIRRWLAGNPAKARRVLNSNPRYIFFRKLNGPGPLGSMGVPLTAGRSMAVDPRFIPMGAPVWLDTRQPASGAPFRRLMVAQDTGAAIKGAIRGDIFFGHGEKAAAAAGRMKQDGRIFVLVPKKSRFTVSSVR